MRYTFPVRITYEGDEKAAARYVGEARSLLGELVRDLGESNILSGKRERRLGSTTIKVAYDGTVAQIRIIAASVPLQLLGVKKGELWIPRGFVVYPATDTAPIGWGLPIVQITADDLTPYDEPNLAPGLDVSRWTVGGGRGQVLLTDRADMGYPSQGDLVVPLMFSREYGPVAEADADFSYDVVSYTAHRLELTGFADTQSPGATEEETPAIISFKRGVFELVNEHRVSVGRTTLEMPIRGFYDSAQITAEISYESHTLGHYASQFPPGYATPDDRMTRDGLHDFFVEYTDPNSRNANIGENVIANSNGPPTVTGVDPDGVDIWDIPNPGPDLTASSAVAGWLASPSHLAVIEDPDWDQWGPSVTCTNVGSRHNFGTQHFQRNDQWITCGNRQFDCPDGLAPITWFGFPSMNLAWETWPATITIDLDEPVVPFDIPFSVNDDTSCWLAYYYGADESCFYPALSRVVYSAGRAIAYAPGLVWAAGVHKLESGLYRLVVLTHNEADQPEDKKFYGMTPMLRVYYCDMEALPGGALAPAAMIRGIYGSEDEGWPWDQVNNPCSWRGGDLLDVSSYTGSGDPNLLKYRSQWVFNADATKAACMRDQGTYTNTTGPIIGGYALYPYNTTVGTFTDGLFAATVVMDLVHAAGSLTPSLSYLERWIGDGFLPTPEPCNEFFVEHIAVDFDDDGELIFASRGGGFTIGSQASAGPTSTVAMTTAYYAFGVGPYETDPSTQPGFAYLTPDPDFCTIARMWNRIHVLSVRDRVFIIERPPEGSPCFVDTASTALHIEMFINGVSQGVVLTPNPTQVWATLRCCFQIAGVGSVFARMAYLSTSEIVQGYYAKRGDDYIAGFNVMPQRNAAFRLATWPSPHPACNSGSCFPTAYDRSLNIVSADFSDMVRLGDFVTSSLGDAAALQSLTAAEGDAFRLMYARVA